MNPNYEYKDLKDVIITMESWAEGYDCHATIPMKIYRNFLKYLKRFEEQSRTALEAKEKAEKIDIDEEAKKLGLRLISNEMYQTLSPAEEKLSRWQHFKIFLFGED